MCVVEGLEKDSGVQEVDCMLVYGVFDCDGRVMAVEGVDELWEKGNVVGPDANDIVQESTVQGW